MTDPMSRRKLLIGCGVGATAILSELYVPQRRSPQLSEQKFDSLFPQRVGEWAYQGSAGLVLPPQDQLSRALYELLLTRIYADNNKDHPPVMVVVAYSSVQEGRLQVHRPEVCYPSAGFTIASNVKTTISLSKSLAIPARYIVADRGARRECVLYWTRVGPAMPQAWVEQRLMMAQANLEGYIPDGLLGRVSVISDNTTMALSLLSDFVRTLIHAMTPGGRGLLIGNALVKQFV